MLLNTIKFCINRQCLQFSARQCTIALNLGDFHSKFTEEQQQQILNTLNTSNAEHLSQLGIPLNRIKNIKSWQVKKGPFKALIDVLEVDGLGIKILEKICTSIVDNQVVVLPKTTAPGRRQYLSPALSKDHSQSMTNAVGLHLGPAGISWAKLSNDNRLLNWNYFKFVELPKKSLPTDTFKLLQSVLLEIPPADIYIFEQHPHRASQSVSHNQNLEILAMLLALINTSPTHNINSVSLPGQQQNCVYYLRANLAARLFRTLMGTERVSSILAVNQLLDGVNAHCKVKVDALLKEDYLSRSSIGQELLGQALLLIVAFMEICVLKNPNSIALVSRSKKVLEAKK